MLTSCFQSLMLMYVKSIFFNKVQVVKSRRLFFMFVCTDVDHVTLLLRRIFVVDFLE